MDDPLLNGRPLAAQQTRRIVSALTQLQGLDFDFEEETVCGQP